jgi:flavin reductase (DIM6/NTAB) family NADH-FMN oxidoreductase RutF
MTALELITADLDYPMLVVTAAAGDARDGCLVGFASQCSLDPVRYMVWLSRQNRTYRVAGEAAVLGVHFLASSQKELAARFGEVSGDTEDKLADCAWRMTSGAVVLSDCARWLVGRIVGRCDGGDHVGFVLEPIDAAAGDWPGQLGFQMVRDLEAGHPA